MLNGMKNLKQRERGSVGRDFPLEKKQGLILYTCCALLLWNSMMQAVCMLYSLLITNLRREKKKEKEKGKVKRNL